MVITSFAQALGIVSFLLGVICFYQKNDRKLKVTLAALHLNNIFHFLLLGAHTASFGAGLSLVRTGVALKTDSYWAALIFIVLTLVFGGWIAASPVDFFPILGSCIGTYATFCLKGIKMRIAFLCGALCWLGNNLIVGSIGGTLLELIVISVNLNTIRRLMSRT